MQPTFRVSKHLSSTCLLPFYRRSVLQTRGARGDDFFSRTVGELELSTLSAPVVLYVSLSSHMTPCLLRHYGSFLRDARVVVAREVTQCERYSNRKSVGRKPSVNRVNHASSCCLSLVTWRVTLSVLRHVTSFKHRLLLMVQINEKKNQINYCNIFYANFQ